MQQGARDKIITELKRGLAWKLCTDLLVPPLGVMTVARAHKSDSDETKLNKRLEYEKQKAALDKERSKREPELIGKLNEVIERVRSSRNEKLADNEEVWLTVVGNERERPKLFCSYCKNNDQSCFIVDTRTGDTICVGEGHSGCGNVVQDHYVEESSQFRRFADDTEDRNHHGPQYDPLMPDSVNLQTGLIGTDATFKKLARTHQDVEMNLSNISSDDRRTRTWYRNKMKQDAFELMRDVAATLDIHKSVLLRAREEFARFRDVREHVHNFHAVVAACLVLAMEDVTLAMNLDQLTTKAPTYVKTERSGYSVMDALTHTLKANEVEVTALRDVAIGKWTEEQTSQWLQAVLGNGHDQAVSCIIHALNRTTTNHITPTLTTISGNSSNTTAANAAKLIPTAELGGPSIGAKKRKYPDQLPSFFGSGTAESRRKKHQKRVQSTNTSGSCGGDICGDNAGQNGAAKNTAATAAGIVSHDGVSDGVGDGMSRSSYGQALLRLDLDSLVTQNPTRAETGDGENDGTGFGDGDGDVENEASQPKLSANQKPPNNGLTNQEAHLVKAAIKNRSAFEAAKRERDRLLNLEAWRLRTETSSRHVLGGEVALLGGTKSLRDDDDDDDAWTPPIATALGQSTDRSRAGAGAGELDNDIMSASGGADSVEVEDELLAHILRANREAEAKSTRVLSAADREGDGYDPTGGVDDGAAADDDDDDNEVGSSSGAIGGSKPTGVEKHIASSASTRASFNITFNIG